MTKTAIIACFLRALLKTTRRVELSDTHRVLDAPTNAFSHIFDF